ncbi:hypothetical protein CDEST_15582 [Colletotrichum destructivum]|uniref:EC45 protein n=1 Tax=Colletotrichum destructivum TaxID=34406 RepID=A0AAX4J4R9_9PEZI|nr:hypothetical protein CDEST_15582 [Colletotrichum destructivum]
MRISVAVFTSALVLGVLAAPIDKIAPASTINTLNDDVVNATVVDPSYIKKREKYFEGGGGGRGGRGGGRGGGKGKDKSKDHGTRGGGGGGGGGGTSKPPDPSCGHDKKDSIDVGC